MCEEPRRHSGIDRAYDEGQDLIAVDVDADRPARRSRCLQSQERAPHAGAKQVAASRWQRSAAPAISQKILRRRHLAASGSVGRIDMIPIGRR